jgi:uncharacterized protein (TIGR02265 family)
VAWRWCDGAGAILGRKEKAVVRPRSWAILATMSANAVRGYLLASRVEFVEKRYGVEILDRLFAVLPPEDQVLRTRQIERGDWYDFESIVRLDRAIARLVSPGDPRIYEQLGEASAQNWVDWVGRDTTGLVTVHTFLSRAAERHSEIQTFGTADYERLGFSEGELTFANYPIVVDIWCRSAIGFLRRAVELVGGWRAQADETRCQARGESACTFRLRWEKNLT